MKIILNKDVQNLGEEGDVRDVAPGYARNYLFPKGFGVAYTKQNLALLEGKRKAIEKRKEEKKERAAGVKERIEALDLQISMTSGETGRLFGSVTNAMLAEELSKLGIEVERKKIEIPEHTIKTTGNFVVKVKLYGSEVASLKVTVSGPKGPASEKKEDEAEAAAKTAEGEAAAQESELSEAETAGEAESSEAAEVVADESQAEVEEPPESDVPEAAAPTEEATDSSEETPAAEEESSAEASDEEPAERE